MEGSRIPTLDDKPGPSPFSVRREDSIALNSSRGFRILRSYLDENVESRFCDFHEPAVSTHSAYLLHRAVIHALVAPVTQIHTRATQLATRARKIGATVCDDEDQTRDEYDDDDSSLSHSSRDADLELFFAGAARDAYVALDGIVTVDEAWCAGSGCPACLTERAMTDESSLRLLLGALSLAEAHPTPATVSSPSPDQASKSAPLILDGGYFSLVSSNASDSSDCDAGYASSVSDDSYSGSNTDDDNVLCRVASTTSSLATSVAASPSISLCASPQLIACRTPPTSTSGPAFASTANSAPLPTKDHPASLPDLLFFRSSILSAIAADPFYGPHSILELVERGWALARGLEALVDACAELEDILSEIEEDVTVEDFIEDPASLIVSSPAEEYDDDEYIDGAALAWVDELDLLDTPRRSSFPRNDEAHVSCYDDASCAKQIGASNHSDTVFDAVHRIARSWHLQPVWTKTALWEALPNAADRRALVEMMRVVGEDEGWCGVTSLTYADDVTSRTRHERRSSWHY